MATNNNCSNKHPFIIKIFHDKGTEILLKHANNKIIRKNYARKLIGSCFKLDKKNIDLFLNSLIEEGMIERAGFQAYRIKEREGI